MLKLKYSCDSFVTSKINTEKLSDAAVNLHGLLSVTEL